MNTIKKTAAVMAIIALTSAPLYAAQSGGFVDPNAPQAQVTQPGGFSGPNGTQTTVQQALKMNDDAWVTLRGHIEKQTGDKHYQFRDATGVMPVKIKPERWQGLTVGPKDNVELQGELDKDHGSMELKVRQLHKVAD